MRNSHNNNDLTAHNNDKPDRCGKTADEGGKWQENTD